MAATRARASGTRTPAARAAKPDAVGVAAVDLAREAAEDVAGPGQVGEHLGVRTEAERVTVHRFATAHAGYRGWEWTVVLARVPRARVATVSEVVLLPGDDALLAPAWVPWADRVAPGDLGETDVLPFRDDDPDLDQGFEAVPDGWDDAFSGEETALVWELGRGRRRVLNREGRIEAANRWYGGDHGPDNAETRAAEAPCASCGYLVGLTGSFRQSFGVCANAWSPDDGRVVSLDHGCGAHSETGHEEPEEHDADQPLVDDLREDLDTEPLADEPTADAVSVEDVTPEDVAPEDVSAEDVSVADVGAEDVGADDVTLEVVTPEVMAPEDVTSEDVTSEGEAPEAVAPDEATTDEATIPPASA